MLTTITKNSVQTEHEKKFKDQNILDIFTKSLRNLNFLDQCRKAVEDSVLSVTVSNQIHVDNTIFSREKCAGREKLRKK